MARLDSVKRVRQQQLVTHRPRPLSSCSVKLGCRVESESRRAEGANPGDLEAVAIIQNTGDRAAHGGHAHAHAPVEYSDTELPPLWGLVVPVMAVYRLE